MSTPICIYHGNCADGFGAAWAVWKKHPDWQFYPGVYQKPPPDVTGRHVVMVDFSYKRPVLDKMAKSAQSILILDHHKTAAEDLTDLPQPRGGWDMHIGYLGAPGCGHVAAVFDQEQSGAMLAWLYFHPEAFPPKLIEHIQDRDLWKFDLPFTREIQATIFSYPYDFEIWDDLVRACEIDALRKKMIDEGSGILRKHDKDVAELVEVCRREMIIGGHAVPAASLPYTLTSDAGHLMCSQPWGAARGQNLPASGPPFAACYWDTPTGRVFSLRSVEGGADVQEIAKQYGGGGHKHAAGFEVPHDRIGEFELPI